MFVTTAEVKAVVTAFGRCCTSGSGTKMLRLAAVVCLLAAVVSLVSAQDVTQPYFGGYQ